MKNVDIKKAFVFIAKTLLLGPVPTLLGWAVGWIGMTVIFQLFGFPPMSFYKFDYTVGRFLIDLAAVGISGLGFAIALLIAMIGIHRMARYRNLAFGCEGIIVITLYYFFSGVFGFVVYRFIVFELLRFFIFR